MTLNRLLFARLTASLLTAGLFVGVGGCDREQQGIVVVDVPKQPEMHPRAATTMPGMAATAGAAQGIPSGPGEVMRWTTPEGWKPIRGDQMRLAAFQVTPERQDVVVTIVVAGGSLLSNINRWEGQAGLPPTAEKDLANVVKHSQSNGLEIDSVDLQGPASANPRLRTLGAIITHGDRTWFFKLQGPDSIVAPNAAKFDAFVKSIKFVSDSNSQEQSQGGTPDAGASAPQLPVGHPPMPGATAPEPTATGGGTSAAVRAAAQIKFTAPQGWIQDPELPLRTASFHLGSGDKQADIIITELAASGSGTREDNISRWRTQVGLPALKQGEAQPSLPILVGGADGAQFEFVGTQAPVRRLVVAWIPRGESWWFFKLVGPDDVVSQQKANFQAFLNSVQFTGSNPQ